MSEHEKARKKVDIEVNKKELDINQASLEIPSSDISTGPKFGCRHVQSILLCLGLVFGIGTRTNLSVAIVAMTDNTTSPNTNVPTYEWNNTSVILSAFFWSYITLQVLAGSLGKTYGPKYFLLVALFINYCACAATPEAAKTMGSGGVILCRVVQGMTQGFLYPSIHVMLGTWIPHQERTTLINVIFSGGQIGSMFASLLTGYVSASWWGWTYSFYILAGLGILWCILWGCLGQNSPATHPRITAEEKKYIQESLKQEDDVNVPTPWKKIFTCVPFYAILAAYIGSAWGYTIMLTETPTYLSKIMNFDLKSNALINSIPTALGLVCGFITGPLSDWIISRNYLSTLNARRIFHLIGSYGQAVCLLWLSFLTKSQANLSIIVLALANALTSCLLVGSNVNHIDLSPRFCGVIFGILNASSLATSIFAPLVAQWVITDVSNIAQWRILFLTAVAMYIAGGTVFFFFASATRQSWDGPEDKELQERRKKISVISFTGI